MKQFLQLSQVYFHNLSQTTSTLNTDGPTNKQKEEPLTSTHGSVASEVFLLSWRTHMKMRLLNRRTKQMRSAAAPADDQDWERERPAQLGTAFALKSRIERMSKAPYVSRW